MARSELEMMTFAQWVDRSLQVVEGNAEVFRPVWDIRNAAITWFREYQAATQAHAHNPSGEEGSTNQALFALNSQILHCYSEMVLIVGAFGLYDPLVVWWRRIDELAATSEFLAYIHEEVPDVYAHRWIHHQIIAWGARNPSSPDVSQDARSSKATFRNEPRFASRGQWANPQPNPTSYANLDREPERRSYVRRVKLDRVGGNIAGVTSVEATYCIDADIRKVANAVLHPVFMTKGEIPENVRPVTVIISATRRVLDAARAWRNSTTDVVGLAFDNGFPDLMRSYDCENADALDDAWCRCTLAMLELFRLAGMTSPTPDPRMD